MHLRRAFIVGTALFTLFTGASASGAEPQTLTQVIGPWSDPKSSDLTAEQLTGLMEKEVTTRDLERATYILDVQMTPAQYRNYALLKRAFAMGWLDPLLSTRGSSAADDSNCDKSDRQAQTRGLRFGGSGRCPFLQREAAKWIFARLNRIDEADSDYALRKMFLLQSTAGADLSPLEVLMAVDGPFPDIPPNTRPYRLALRPGHDFPAGKTFVPFESWDPWKGRPDPRVKSADVVFFADQSLESPYGGLLLSPESVETSEERPHSLYMIGNRLQLGGPYRVEFEPECRIDQETYQPKCKPVDRHQFNLVTNTLVLGGASDPPDLKGLLDRHGYNSDDLAERPALSIVNADAAVILSSNFVLGPALANRISRNWNAIAPDAWKKDRPASCPLSQRFYETALKQVDVELNSAAQALIASAASGDCVQQMTRLWPAVIREEVSARPANLLFRFIQVENEGRDIFPYVGNNLDDAAAVFSQRNLELWGLTYARRLKLKVQSAQLQENRDELGAALRETDALRSHLLAEPTSLTLTELTGVLGDLAQFRKELANSRILLRGTSFTDEPALASSWLLGAAAARDTWLVPTELGLQPLSPDSGRLGRMWVGNATEADPEVHLQFLARFIAGSEAEAAAGRALAARGFRYAGVSSELVVGGVRQNSVGDWRFENPLALGGNRLLLTIATRQSGLGLLLQQLNSTGLAVEVDWKSGDPLVSSESAGPVRSLIRMSHLQWPPLAASGGEIRNPSPVPVEVVALRQDEIVRALEPPLGIGGNQAVKIPAGILTAFKRPSPILADTVFDPGGEVKAIDKLEIAGPDSSVLQVRVFNMLDSVEGGRVRSARLRLAIRDGGGKQWMDDIQLSLARFGLPEANASLSLLLPAGFHILVAGDFVTEAGSVIPIKPQDSTSTDIYLK